MTLTDTRPHAATDADLGYPPSNVASIPELADHWKKLDLREILSRPAAFLSISQSNSLYKPGGVQYGERHDLRGSLPATVKVGAGRQGGGELRLVQLDRLHRLPPDSPKTDFDPRAVRLVDRRWMPPRSRSPGTTSWSASCATRASRDNEFYECALQTAFTGTGLPLESARKTRRGARHHRHPHRLVHRGQRAGRPRPRLLPIVIGDATGCQKPDSRPPRSSASTSSSRR